MDTNDVKRLSDAELEGASGGLGINNIQKPDIGKAYCPKCGKVTEVELYSGGRARCLTCNTQISGV